MLCSDLLDYPCYPWMLCPDLLDYPSDGWLTELTILAKPLSLVLLLDYPKTRSALQQRFAIALSPNPTSKT
jgi:hypothetical protein